MRKTAIAITVACGLWAGPAAAQHAMGVGQASVESDGGEYAAAAGLSAYNACCAPSGQQLSAPADDAWINEQAANLGRQNAQWISDQLDQADQALANMYHSAGQSFDGAFTLSNTMGDFSFATGNSGSGGGGFTGSSTGSAE